MSKQKRYILIGLLAFLIVGILVLCWLIKPAEDANLADADEEEVPVADSIDGDMYEVEGIATELGDLTVYDVTVEGDPYKLVKIKGQPDQLISYEDYYRAEVGDTE